MMNRNCQALVPSPVLLDQKPNPNQSKIKIQVQLVLGWHNDHMRHSPHHPTTFNHEEVLWGKSLRMTPQTHPGGQVDQVDSKIKDMG